MTKFTTQALVLAGLLALQGAPAMAGCELWVSYQGITQYVTAFEVTSDTAELRFHPDLPDWVYGQVKINFDNHQRCQEEQACYVIDLIPGEIYYSVSEDGAENDCCELRDRDDPVYGTPYCTPDPSGTPTPTETPEETETPDPGGEPTSTPTKTATPTPTPTATATEEPTNSPPPTPPLASPSPTSTPQLVSIVVNGPFPPFLHVTRDKLANVSTDIFAEIRGAAYSSEGLDDEGSWSYAIVTTSAKQPQVEFQVSTQNGNPMSLYAYPSGTFEDLFSGNVVVRVTYTRADGAEMSADRTLGIIKSGLEGEQVTGLGPPPKSTVKWMIRSR